MLHKLLLFLKARKKQPECERCRWVLWAMTRTGYVKEKKITSEEMRIMLDYWHDQHS